MSEVCRAVEEVESSRDSLKCYPHDCLSENLTRHHVLKSPQTQAKRRQNENLMCTIRSLQLKKVLELSDHFTSWVI